MYDKHPVLADPKSFLHLGLCIPTIPQSKQVSNEEAMSNLTRTRSMSVLTCKLIQILYKQCRLLRTFLHPKAQCEVRVELFSGHQAPKKRKEKKCYGEIPCKRHSYHGKKNHTKNATDFYIRVCKNCSEFVRINHASVTRGISMQTPFYPNILRCGNMEDKRPQCITRQQS